LDLGEQNTFYVACRCSVHLT